jgi:hypothetical protein
MHGLLVSFIYTTYKSANIFFSKTTQQMYTNKVAPPDQSQQSNLTVQISVIPPNQNSWVHLSFYNDGPMLIPSPSRSAPASTGTIRGTISTNAKWIRYSRITAPTLAAARVRLATSSKNTAVVTIPSRGYPTHSRGVAAARCRCRNSPCAPTTPQADDVATVISAHHRRNRRARLPTPRRQRSAHRLLSARSRHRQPSSPHRPLRPRLAAGSPLVHPSGYTA